MVKFLTPQFCILQSQLSLSKLAFLASDIKLNEMSDTLKKIDYDLSLIAYQEDLPLAVMQAYGYDVEKVKVLTPKDLVTVNFTFLRV